MKDTRVFVIETDTDETFRVTCPKSARVTFGPLTPGSKYGGGQNVLRIYEGANKENQYGVFMGVTSFRDTGQVKVERLEKSTSTESKSKQSRLKSEHQALSETHEKWATEE